MQNNNLRAIYPINDNDLKDYTIRLNAIRLKQGPMICVKITIISQSLLIRFLMDNSILCQRITNKRNGRGESERGLTTLLCAHFEISASDNIITNA